MSNEASWSPDGTRLAFVRILFGADKRSVLQIWNEQARSATRVDSSSSSNSCSRGGCINLVRPFYAAWSPDSKQLAYVVGDTAIRIVGSDGTNPRDYRLITRSAGGWSLRWRPDGQMLSYVGAPVASTIVGIDAATGSNERVLLTADGSISDCAWAADSHRIAVATSGAVAVWRDGVRVDGIAIESATDLTWSPDNSRLAFIAYGPGYPPNRDIFTVDSQGHDLQRVSYVPYPDLITGRLRWTPDGRMIAAMFGGLGFFDINGGAEYRLVPEATSYSLVYP